MKKMISIILLVSVFIFNTGCTRIVEVPVYVEATCPKLEVLETVPRIDVNVSKDGALRDVSMHNLIRGAKMLRRSETFYKDQLTKYNDEFVDKQ